LELGDQRDMRRVSPISRIWHPNGIGFPSVTVLTFSVRLHSRVWVWVNLRNSNRVHSKEGEKIFEIGLVLQSTLSSFPRNEDGHLRCGGIGVGVTQPSSAPYEVDGSSPGWGTETGGAKVIRASRNHKIRVKSAPIFCLDGTRSIERASLDIAPSLLLSSEQHHIPKCSRKTVSVKPVRRLYQR